MFVSKQNGGDDDQDNNNQTTIFGQVNDSTNFYSIFNNNNDSSFSKKTINQDIQFNVKQAIGSVKTNSIYPQAPNYNSYQDSSFDFSNDSINFLSSIVIPQFSSNNKQKKQYSIQKKFYKKKQQANKNSTSPKNNQLNKKQKINQRSVDKFPRKFDHLRQSVKQQKKQYKFNINTPKNQQQKLININKSIKKTKIQQQIKEHNPQKKLIPQKKSIVIKGFKSRFQTSKEKGTLLQSSKNIEKIQPKFMQNLKKNRQITQNNQIINKEPEKEIQKKYQNIKKNNFSIKSSKQHISQSSIGGIKNNINNYTKETQIKINKNVTEKFKDQKQTLVKEVKKQINKDIKIEPTRIKQQIAKKNEQNIDMKKKIFQFKPKKLVLRTSKTPEESNNIQVKQLIEKKSKIDKVSGFKKQTNPIQLQKNNSNIFSKIQFSFKFMQQSQSLQKIMKQNKKRLHKSEQHIRQTGKRLTATIKLLKQFYQEN